MSLCRSPILIIAHVFSALTYSQSFRPIYDQTKSLNWFASNIACNNSLPRGQLTSSHSPSDDIQISSICQLTDTVETCWIGLYSIQTRNTPVWEWIDNTPTDYYQFTDDNNPSNPAGNLQTCVSISAVNDSILWNKQDCSEQLFGAVCLSCGELNEYCCGIDAQCNNDDLECVENRCVESEEIVRIDLVNKQNNDNGNESVVSAPEKYDQSHAVEIATVSVFVFMFCAGVCACVDSKKKGKKKKKSNTFKHQQLAVRDEAEPSNTVADRERLFSMSGDGIV